MNHTDGLQSKYNTTRIFGREFKDIKPWQKVDRARVFHVQIFLHAKGLILLAEYLTDRLGDDLYNFVQSIPMGGVYNSSHARSKYLLLD